MMNPGSHKSQTRMVVYVSERYMIYHTSRLSSVSGKEDELSSCEVGVDIHFNSIESLENK